MCIFLALHTACSRFPCQTPTLLHALQTHGLLSGTSAQPFRFVNTFILYVCKTDSIEMQGWDAAGSLDYSCSSLHGPVWLNSGKPPQSIFFERVNPVVLLCFSNKSLPNEFSGLYQGLLSAWFLAFQFIVYNKACCFSLIVINSKCFSLFICTSFVCSFKCPHCKAVCFPKSFSTPPLLSSHKPN